MQITATRTDPPVFKNLPCGGAEDGRALVGDLNFPGPGWSGSYRTRPTNYFDLASKLHDAAYEINDLNISFNPVSKREDLIQSKKARADRMFRLMNREKPEKYWSWSSKWLWGSRQIFDGDDDEKGIMPHDGYLSVFHPHYLRLLSDPTNYLMIPYCALPPDQQPMIDTNQLGFFGHIQEYGKDFLHQNYGQHDYNKEVPMDRQVPFPDWIKREYANIWKDLIGLGGIDDIPDDPGAAAQCTLGKKQS